MWNFDSLSITYPTLLVAIAAVLVARLAVVYLLLPISDRLPFAKAVDSHSKKVMFWGGLRGVVPVALMLSIPDSIPEKPLIIEMTLIVILFSLLVQGTTIGWLMSVLGIKKQSG